PRFEHPCMEPFANQTQDDSIAYPVLQQFTQTTVVQSIEELLDIDIENPLDTQVHRLVPEAFQGSMSRATATESVGAVVEVPLIDRFQDHHDRALQDLVLDGRNSDRAGLGGRASFRNVDAPHRWGAVRATLGAVQERPEVLLKVRFIVRPGLAIDARRP